VCNEYKHLCVYTLLAEGSATKRSDTLDALIIPLYYNRVTDELGCVAHHSAPHALVKPWSLDPTPVLLALLQVVLWVGGVLALTKIVRGRSAHLTGSTPDNGGVFGEEGEGKRAVR